MSDSREYAARRAVGIAADQGIGCARVAVITARWAVGITDFVDVQLAIAAERRAVVIHSDIAAGGAAAIAMDTAGDFTKATGSTAARDATAQGVHRAAVAVLARRWTVTVADFPFPNHPIAAYIGAVIVIRAGAAGRAAAVVAHTRRDGDAAARRTAAGSAAREDVGGAGNAIVAADRAVGAIAGLAHVEDAIAAGR